MKTTTITRPQEVSSPFNTELLKAGNLPLSTTLDPTPADDILFCFPTSKDDGPLFATFDKVVDRTATLPQVMRRSSSLSNIDPQTIGNTPEKIGDTSIEPKITPDFQDIKNSQDEYSPT